MKLFILLLTLISIPAVKSGKILVWPAEWSHWINMKIIVKELVNNGHQVTVMRSSAYTDFLTNDFDIVDWYDFEVPFDEGFHLKSHNRHLLATKLGDRKEMSLWKTIYESICFFYEQINMRCTQCEVLISNNHVMDDLSRKNFDLVLADPSVPCGELLAKKLKIPFVYNVRTLPGEMHFVLSQTPLPLSYVPTINSAYSDDMNLYQRTWNFINYLLQSVAMKIVFGLKFNSIVHQHVSPNQGYLEIVSESSMWLIRTDFSFEYPRPMMPNIQFIGGFHCKEAEQISEVDLAAWADGADEGLIIFSMGSMISDMHHTKSAVIASALSKLRQRVVWRYSGVVPDNIGSNIKIMDWFPQNDLMGHKNTKLFITHGGTNGLYEAIYHAVPVLGMPLLVDQFDNMLRITGRRAGRSLDFADLTEDELYQTISSILEDESYSNAVRQMSILHRDKPISPLEQAIYWIEYTMRTDGAKHLRPASHKLTWYQYYLIDSVFLILGTLSIAIFLYKFWHRRTLKLSY